MKTIHQISLGLTGAIALSHRRIWNSSCCQIEFNSIIRIILVCMVFCLNSYKVPGGSLVITEEMKFQAERAMFYFEIRDQPFSEELLGKCLYYEQIEYKDIVLLQARLETGHYRSDIFLNGNNLFGMRLARSRPTFATGSYKDHAQYSHWSESVKDYALWQKWYLSKGYRIGGNNDNDFYLVFLNSIPYAADPRYIPKLVAMSQMDVT